LEVLRSCDLVAAEDTRHTGLLLKHYEISKPQISLHEHNEASRTQDLLQRMQDGSHVALVSDAGTPAISDPGARLIRETRKAGLAIEVLPGACAAITALVGSGFDTSAFAFAGFLPNKSGRRLRVLTEAIQRTSTTLFYESPHRLLKTLEALRQLAPERPLCVARELTKKFEEFRRGTPSELITHYSSHPPKGEICLVIPGADEFGAPKIETPDSNDEL
jgi:16S rRNA (cytidine1402-2'-O)-methyltransferase